MPLITVGVNHRTAPLDVRERLSVAPQRMPETLDELRAIDGIDDRGELDQHAVARCLDDAAAMLRHQRVAHNAVLAERARGPGLVEPHEPAVAGHVGGQYRRQPAFDPTRPLSSHGVQSPLEAMLHDQATSAQYALERLLPRRPV